MRQRFRLQLPGLLYIVLTLFVGFAASHRPNNLVVWAFGVLLAIILVSGFISATMLRRVRVTRMEARRAVVGEPLEIRYMLENSSSLRSAFALRVEEIPQEPKGTDSFHARPPEHAWTVRVGARESQVCDAILWPSRRGAMQLKRIRLSSSFPFGLLDRYVEFDAEQKVLVQPNVHPVRGDLLKTVARGELGGVGVSRMPGPGDDFYSVREFKPGDSIRHVAWKRLGSSEELLVVQRSTSPPPRLRVILDLTIPTDRIRYDQDLGLEPGELEERAIVMAASLISSAEMSGIEFGLSIHGTGERPTPLRRGYWHRERALATLAAIDLAQDRTEVPAFAPDDDERTSVVMIHPGRVDPRIAPTRSWHWSSSQFEELLDSSVSGSGPGPGRVMTLPQLEFQT